MILNEEQSLIQATAQTFSESFLKPQAAEWASSHTFPKTAISELAKLGFLGMLVPEQWGGSNIGFTAYALVIEALAAGDASTSTIVSVHNSIVCGAILHYGNDQQKNEFLRPLAQGTKLGAFCLTESQAGSDAAEIKTRAEIYADHFVLNGHKQFITSGKTADIAVVFANVDPECHETGITAFIVPTHSPGYSVTAIENKMGQSAAETVQLKFENLKIPKANLLGELGQGYKIALSELESGRIGIAAQSVGIAKAAFEIALHYAKERHTFGKPIIEHQAIGFKLADMATKIEAARALTMQAALLKDHNQSALKAAAMAKLLASETAEWVCREAIQIHGGYGYIKDFLVERLYRDARATTLYEGTSEIQRLLIARKL